jgi:hypothetical protein
VISRGVVRQPKRYKLSLIFGRSVGRGGMRVERYLIQAYRFPPNVIRHAVWLYFRFTLIPSDGYAPRLVIDDRDQVVAMWHARGLTCQQYAPDDS